MTRIYVFVGVLLCGILARAQSMKNGADSNAKSPANITLSSSSPAKNVSGPTSAVTKVDSVTVETTTLSAVSPTTRKAKTVPKKGVEEITSVPRKGVTESGGESKKKELDSPTFSGENRDSRHGVTGRKGVGDKPEPVNLNRAENATGKAGGEMNATATNSPATDEAPKSSLVAGAVFGAILFAVFVFVAVKQVEAMRRRREYRRMNDFLIDGMYNDM